MIRFVFVSKVEVLAPIIVCTVCSTEGKGGTCAGLALDAKNFILFSACRNPANMVILNADDGKIITTLPIGTGSDGAGFNPNTMEAFSSQGDGTLTIIEENSPSTDGQATGAILSLTQGADSPPPG